MSSPTGVPPNPFSDPAVAQAIVKNTLQPFLLGLWFSIALWTLQLLMAHKWYSKFWDKDHWLVKVAVIVMLTNELVALMIALTDTYTATITHWDDHLYLITPRWQKGTFSLFLGTPALVLQLYLLIRYYRISQNLWLTIPLAIAALVSYGFCLRLTVGLLITLTPPSRSFVLAVVKSWFSISISTDLLIATFLSYSLLRLRKGVTAASTQVLIRQMIILSFETGLVTAAIQIASLVAYIKNPTGSISIGIAFPLRTIFGIVLFYNLLIRTSLRKAVTHRIVVSSQKGPVGGAEGTRSGVIGGIAVVSQTIIKASVDERAIDLEAAAKFYRRGAEKKKENDNKRSLSQREMDDGEIFEMNVPNTFLENRVQIA